MPTQPQSESPIRFWRSEAATVSAVLFLAPALSMLLTSIYPFLGFILAVIGLRHWLRIRRLGRGTLDRSLLSVDSPFLAIWALLAFALITLLLNVYHGERWGAYHVALAIGLLWPGYFATTLPGVKVKALWLGAAVGAMTAFVMAAIQVFYLGSERASGLTNPIPFGNVSLVLATASLIGLPNVGKCKFRWAYLLLHVLGGLAGIGASLLSGSKSGWLSLLILAIVSYRLFPLHTSAKKKWLIGLGALVVVITLIAHPQSPVMPRLKDAWKGANTWFATGQVVEGSIGPRLEMWKFGLQVSMEKPLLGLGKGGMFARKSQAIAAGEYPQSIAEFVTLHNEFLNIWVTNGLVGTLALMAVFGCAFWVFFRIRKSSELNLKSVSLMGTCLVLMYLEFGIGEIALHLNAYRHAFLFWMFALTGLIWQLQRVQATPK